MGRTVETPVKPLPGQQTIRIGKKIEVRWGDNPDWIAHEVEHPFTMQLTGQDGPVLLGRFLNFHIRFDPRQKPQDVKGVEA